MQVRKYHSEDLQIIANLFYDTIHSVNAVDYNEAQLDAWAPKDRDLFEWKNKFSNNYTVVAEKDGIIVGFGNVKGTEYFDCLYTHKDYQGIGVATLIADCIEKNFRDQGIQNITTDASITAKHFFEKRGYLAQQEQIVECRGQLFTNFKMQKILS